MFLRIGVLKNFGKFTGKHLCWESLFKISYRHAYNFIKKETLAQLFFWKFCKIFRNTFLTEHLQVTAFDMRNINPKVYKNDIIKWLT